MTEKVNKSKDGKFKLKEINSALEDCKSANEVFEFLGKILDPKVIKDYAKKAKIPEAINIRGVRASLKLSRTPNSPEEIEDNECMDLAVLRYMKVEGKDIKKDMKDFDNNCKLYAQKLEHRKTFGNEATQDDKTKSQQLTMAIQARLHTHTK